MVNVVEIWTMDFFLLSLSFDKDGYVWRKCKICKSKGLVHHLNVMYCCGEYMCVRPSINLRTLCA